MLDPRTYRKGFAFQLDAAFSEHPEGVPCTVANGENQVLRFHRAPIYEYTLESAVLDGKAGELGLE